MHRLIIICTLMLVLGLTVLTMPKPAQAYGHIISYNLTCSSFSAIGSTNAAFLGIQGADRFAGFQASGGIASGTVTFGPFPEGTLLNIAIYGAINSVGDPDHDPDFYFDEFTCPSSFNWNVSTTPTSLPLFTDGRVNNNDALQTAAVYCDKPSVGDVQIYSVIDNKGSIAFTVTKAELAAGVQKPATPYLIKSGKGAELWRLQDGSLQIMRGTYVFDWPGC